MTFKAEILRVLPHFRHPGNTFILVVLTVLLFLVAPTIAPVVIAVDKSSQEMSVTVGGFERYVWPVSTGKPGHSTPGGVYAPTSMNAIWHSREWDNAPMPHSIFFRKDGHAIHGSNDVRHLGKPASHGCVRLAPENAADLFKLVSAQGMDHTQVIIAGSDPRAAPRPVVIASKKSRATAKRYRADDLATSIARLLKSKETRRLLARAGFELN